MTTAYTKTSIRQENQRDLSLHVMFSHISQRGQEEGGSRPVKGGRQHQATVETKLGIATANLFLPFIPLADKL